MTNSTDSKGIADMIIAQAGGPQIFSMAFKTATYDASGVTFAIAVPARMVTGKATHVVVKLDADDTYTVTLLKVGKLSRRTWEIPETVTIDELEMAYAHDLRTVIESMTGLRLSLGTMGRAS